MDLGVVSLTAAAYAGLLFWLAWAVERHPERFGWVNRPLVYALALAVYCTSWTFYGGVGTAATGGWTYLPIYLGPILVFLFGQDFLRRLAQAVQRENLTSIADFLSSRYGKSRRLAALVTTLATFAALPYIALQLKALGMSAAALLSGDWTAPAQPSYPAVGIVAGLLAMFAILFGARRYEAAGHNRGIVAAVAAEAVVKLAALLLLGGFAFVALAGAPAPAVKGALAEFDALFAVSNLRPDFLTITLLSMAAIVCLPRQFYVGFVEYRRRADLVTASWAFPLYLLATAMIVAPITLAGLAILPPSVSADLFVLDLPLALGADWLALIAFLGGFSAATGMIIVECVALATMISNDLVAPFLLRRGILRERDIGAVMLSVRRIAIAGLLGLAYLYYLKLDASESLAAIGLIAFAAVAQFGPALLAAIYWPKINQRGVMLGLAAGGALWAYTLLLPAYLGADTLTAWANARGFGALLNPQALMGLGGLDPLTHGVVWSLGVNIAVMVAGSVLTPAPIADRLRAAVFNPSLAVAGEGGVRTLGDLAVLVERFVGAREAQASFLAPLGAAKGLSVRAAPTALWVESDRGLLRSAVQNFLSNAVRYTNHGGIVIGCRRRGDRCVIEVWDTGAGIPDTHRSAIFEEFRRMHPAGDEPAAGLGLAIVDRIARLLGAAIDLRSRVGKGSVFAIDAPVAPPALGPVPEDAAKTQAPLKLRVLCVDNDPAILDAMARLLRGWGCRPVRARSYGEAIAALHEARFEAALVDFQLDDPRGTGLDVLAAWREKNPGRPAALVTADAAPSLADAALARGAVLMTKPVPPRDLWAFLEAAPAREKSREQS